MNHNRILHMPEQQFVIIVNNWDNIWVIINWYLEYPNLGCSKSSLKHPAFYCVTGSQQFMHKVEITSENSSN